MWQVYWNLLYFSFIFWEYTSLFTVIIYCFPTKNQHLSLLFLSLSFSLSLNPYVRVLLGKRLFLHPKWPKPALTLVYVPSSVGHHSPEHIRFHTAHNSHPLDSNPRNPMCSLHTLSTKQSVSYSQEILAGTVPCFLLHYLLLTLTYLSLGLTPPPMGGGLISALSIPTALL